MKKIVKYLSCALMLAAATFAGSCSDDPTAVIEEIAYSRVLTPLNFKAEVVPSTGTDIEFTWNPTQNADYYTLELYTDATYQTLVNTYTVLMDEIPYTVTGLAVDTEYYARVSGGSDTLEPSHWAELKSSVTTYPVRKALNPVVTERTATTLVIAWDAAEDAEDLTTIKVNTVLDVEGAEKIELTLTDAQKTAHEATIEGLLPCTEYKATLIFGKSGNRGSVAAWTRPETGSAAKISTAAALYAALNGATAPVELLLDYNDGTAYDLAAVLTAAGTPEVPAPLEITADVKIYGEATAEGAKPTIIGFAPTLKAGCALLHLEDVNFDGNNAGALITNDSAADLVLEIINCEAQNYSKAIYSVGGSAPATSKAITINGLYAHDINATGGGGGDFIDVRNNAMGDVKILNSTFSFAARTFLRISDNASVTSVEVANCTFNAVTATNGSSNNAGIFNVRTKCAPNLTAFTCKNCLFMNEKNDNETESTNWVRLVRNANDSYFPQFDMCYYYNVGPAWWVSSALKPDCNTGAGETVKDAALTNGVELTADPCKNSIAGKLYLTNGLIAANKIGDPRWWNATEKVVIRETELTPVTEGKVWDFTTKTIYDTETVSANTIIDNIQFYGSAANPTEIVMGKGVNFTAPATFAGDVPTGNAVGFLVEGVGTVKVKANGSTPNAMLQVLVDGDRYSVQADGAVHNVPLGDIAGQTMIYVAAGNALQLISVEWSTDLTAETTVTTLKTPAVAFDPAKLDEGTEQEVVASWKAIDNAAVYVVTFRDATVEVTDPVYTIAAADVAALPVGEYEISVVAKPVATSTKFAASEAGTATLKINKVVVGGEKTLTWDFSDAAFNPYYEAITTNNTTTYDDTWDGLRILAGGASIKVGQTTIDGAAARYIQTGGGGSKEKRVLIFDAPAAGTLVVKASNTGGAEDMTRMVVAAMDDAEIARVGGGSVKGVLTPCSFDVPAAGKVYIFTTGGLCLYSVEFTYIEAAHDPVTHKWDFANTTLANGDITAETVCAASEGDRDLTIIATAATKVTMDVSGKRLKMNGASTYEGNVPTARGLMFMAQGNGTLIINHRSASSSGTGRMTRVSVGGEAPQEFEAPVSATDPNVTNPVEVDITGITEPTPVYISVSGGINFYEITWIE